MEETLCNFELGAVSKLTINRPKQLNALNTQVLKEISRAIEAIGRHHQVRVLVIEGSGSKAFVAGADISEMISASSEQIADYIKLGQSVMSSIAKLPVPVVAAVKGFALGGGMELALACDLIYATESSKFGQPEVKLGIIPGFGGTQRLLQRCGIGATRRLCYSGEMISATEALSLGLIDRMLNEEEFDKALNQFTHDLAKQAPLAVASAKKVINGYAYTLLDQGLKYEVQEFLELFKSSDRSEGMEAFLGKRAPSFLGK